MNYIMLKRSSKYSHTKKNNKKNRKKKEKRKRSRRRRIGCQADSQNGAGQYNRPRHTRVPSFFLNCIETILDKHRPFWLIYEPLPFPRRWTVDVYPLGRSRRTETPEDPPPAPAAAAAAAAAV